jgi:hypothetical protein
MVEPIPSPNNISAILTTCYNDDLYDYLKPREAVSGWQWRIRSPQGNIRRGLALLVLEDRGVRWSLLGDHGTPLQTPPDSGWLTLLPLIPTSWHTVQAPWPAACREAPLPLPRQAVQSSRYADLLGLLQDLLGAQERRSLRRWPAIPVPVRAPAATSGEVDLQLCLATAMLLWNASEPDSLFCWNPAATWGVRLIHLPEETTPPPFTVKVVRQDGNGQPLRVHILAGMHFTRAEQRWEAIQGLVRALGRALMLWGESQDAEHVLTHSPDTLNPAADERNAARLLARLPAGLDLCRYGRLTQMDAPR